MFIHKGLEKVITELADITKLLVEDWPDDFGNLKEAQRILIEFKQEWDDAELFTPDRLGGEE